MACNQAQDRTVHIQVKTKRGGRTWHASTKAGRRSTRPIHRGGKLDARLQVKPSVRRTSRGVAMRTCLEGAVLASNEGRTWAG
jgi:hypothetical protein